VEQANLYGINQVEIKNKTISNEGIWQSIQNSIILSLRAGLIATILLFIIQYNNDINLNKVLISSVIGGLFFGLLIGIPIIPI
jgi:ABC-type Fe3+ transport system permease subunit